MGKKVLVSIILIILLVVLITGCSKVNNVVDNVSDESKIINQMNKWAEA